ncbi:MAG: hypothetical protein KC420_17865 [Myxococcales bacterium]|nr:hypothetical protein [Myxococcales bacterium]MCB9566903.1 hypothetical protein [Myxococcales bacterium]MCB9704635.1 hypothetical protein [Myxococcales bacterium]
MAPRPPETRENVIARLRRVDPTAEHLCLRFGSPHNTHAVVVEGGRWQIRRLVLDLARAEAFREEHGYFMPENAEDLSEPGPEVILEAPSLTRLIAAIEAARAWPPAE